ncbi:MAG: MoaD/ThiS family protein [Gammaproteobacteria bacterium]|nr:MoaD/ThiS family protein [Gammaproteobacteria bacterium]MDH3856506.1 MoaD/ThiS family protein [Gammaproteobacteria bacterium]
MQISIEFYASLMKYLPPGKSRFRREIKVDQGLKLARLIEQFHISPEEAHLVLVNGLFVCGEDRAGCELVEGDVVSIWPPVAGG